MKNLLKSLPALLLSMSIIPTVNAQEANVTVEAVVLNDIVVSVDENVNFGNIQRSSSPVIDPQGNSTSDVSENATLGKITVSASANKELFIEWDTQTELADESDSNNKITFYADVATNTSDDAASSTDAGNGASFTTNAIGELYIFIGGNLGTLTGQAVGTYTSSDAGGITFTINYSN